MFNKLKGARVEKGYTQKDMAAKLDISTDAYYQKETGKSEFKLSEIKIILDVLDRNFYDLFMEG